jgi:hypothetical protein
MTLTVQPIPDSGVIIVSGFVKREARPPAKAVQALEPNTDSSAKGKRPPKLSKG